MEQESERSSIELWPQRPMKSIIEEIIREIVTQTKRILEVIELSASGQASLTEEMKRLLQLDTTLQTAVLRLQKHQAFQQQIIKV